MSNRRAVVTLSLLLTILSFADCALRAQSVAFQGVITTVAGKPGTAGYGGDQGAATSAQLQLPMTLSLDRAGNMYIADSYNYRIRKVDTRGIITTVAGNSTQCASGTNACGDGGLATSAQLGFPYGVVLDSAGNLYISDYQLERIRVVCVTASGICSGKTVGDIYNVAGTGTAGYTGNGGLALSAQLTGPRGIALDSAGNLYIADTGNSAIREVLAGGAIVTVAGTGIQGYNGDNIAATSAELYSPMGVTLDAAGNLYIADRDNNRIRRVNAATGIISTVVGNGTACATDPVSCGDGGQATSAELLYPRGVAVDGAGNLYIADWADCVIRKVSASTGVITTVTGNWYGTYNGDYIPAPSAGIYSPSGLALDAKGDMYIADSGDALIREVQFSAVNFGAVKVGSSSPTYSLGFSLSDGTHVGSIAVLTQGAAGQDFQKAGGTCVAGNYGTGATCTVNVTFAPLAPGVRKGAVVLYDNSTPAKALVTLNIYGTGVAPTVDFPPGTTWRVAGLYIPHYGNVFGYSGDGGPATSAELDWPNGVAFDGAGNLYISDRTNLRVRKVDTSGIITTVAGNGTQATSGDGGPATSASLYWPQSVAVDGAGNLYIADGNDTWVSNIRKVDTNGNITTIAGGGWGNGGYSGDNIPASQAQLDGIRKLLIDGAGNIYIADQFNYRVRKIDTNGIITTVAGNGTQGYSGDGQQATSAELNYPTGLAMDQAGNLFIVDSNYVVRKVDTSGVITTVAGNGSYGYSGDGGPAINAGINPNTIAVDAAGNLWLGEGLRVRKVDTSGIITTALGYGNITYSPDGTLATQAGVNSPADLAFDDLGNIYVADSVSVAITKIDIVDPPSLSFPNTNVGSTSAAQDVTVENRGNATLTFSHTIPYGDFTLTGHDTTCITGEQVLNVDATCVFGIQFAPQTGGPQSGSVVLTDNALNANPATQTILTSGNGIAVTTVPTVTTTAITSIAATTASGGGNVTADGGATVTARGICWGISTNPTTANTCTANGTGTGAFTSSITGLASGTQYNVRAYATNSIGTAYGADLAFTTAAPTVSLAPSPVPFGNQTIGTTSSPAKVVVLTNTGNATVTGISISVTGTNANAFGVSSTCAATLTAGSSCNISLSFTPTMIGANSASLSVSDNATGSPQTVPLSGTGLAANVVAPGPLVFNPAAVGISAASAQILTATFQMNGFVAGFTPTAALHYGLSYSLGTVNCSGVAGNETCSVPVTFQPQYPGGRRDAIFLMSGTTRLATLLIYGVGQGPFSMVQPGVITNPILNNANYLYTSIVDENGTAYVLGDNSNTIYTVTKAGVVGTLPVTGLNSPRGIGIDGAGVIYIADQAAHGPTKTYDTVQGIQGTVAFPSSASYVQGLAVGNTGNLYETDYTNVYTVPIVGPGTAATTVITPANTQASNLIVDSNENIFVGGSQINEIASGGVQTQINTVGAGQGLGVDAADTLYATRYTGGGVAELPASGYGTALASLDTGAGPLGSSVGPDGTVYVGNYNNLDKVDRSQGLIAFGEQYQAFGTPSPQQIVTMYNGGNQTLTISNISISGSPFSIQTATGTNCTNGSTVAPGALCQIAVVMTPVHAGVFNGSVTVTSNSLNGSSTTQTIALTAFTYGIYVTETPNPLNFPSQTVNTTSATQTVTLTNNGDLYSAGINGGFASTSPAFTVTSGTCTSNLIVGASCQLNVTFTPTLAQSYSATISFSEASSGGGANQPVSFTVTGTGTPAAAPQATLSPNPLAFPNTLVGTSATALPITLSNPGNAALTITSISVTGTNASSFGQTNNCGGSLAAGGTCTITVTFTPASTGSLSAAISVADNATGSPQSAVITGTGTKPQATLSPNPLAFPNTLVGTAATALPMTLSNPGTGALTITSISVTGTNASSFAQTNNCGTSLTAGGTCTITVTFTPATAASLSAAISVADNATGSPQSAVITGTGTQPQATLSPNPLAFPNTLVGTPATALPMTLSNPGTAALTITSISVIGTNASSFAQTNNCGTSVAAGATCTITVTFTPAATGSLSASISVADNATGSPQTAALTGTGTQPQAALSPNPLAFPNTPVGTSATALPMTLSNPGTAALTITSISVTGTNASSFAQTNNCGTSLAAAATCTITVTFTPATATSLSAAISVADSASGSPQSAVVTGTGTVPLVPQAVLSPNPLAFPSTNVGTAATPLPMTLSNPGNAALAISNIGVAGTNASSFGQTNNCGTSLAAGGTCTISVTFTPASAGSLSAAISVADNAAGSPHSAVVTGTGSTATYVVNASTPTASVPPGAMAQFNIMVAPLGGSYNNMVTLSATGLPAGAKYSFQPSAVMPGSAGAPSVLSIQTSSGLALLNSESRRQNSLPMLALLAGVPLLGLAGRLRRLSRPIGRCIFLGLAVLATLPIVAISGCGGGYFGPPPQTYTVTVTGTSGSLQETTTVTLTVQ
jgi:hypothetical protein